MPMEDTIKAQVLASWNRLPQDCRLRCATEAELAEFEARWMPIPADFRWFLMACGGGPVGSEWVDNIDQLHASHDKYRSEAGPGGWTMRDFFIVGWDGSGNPYGIDLASGKVVVEDHTFGGVHVLAQSFEAFLVNGQVAKGEERRRTRS